MTAGGVGAGSPAAPQSGRRPWSWPLVVAGMCLLLLSWILVVPPFGGTDEFDHAYRAAATARGQWLVTPSDATRGTGAWLRVPGDVVRAARPECQARVYTTAVDCVGTPQGSDVRIASAAGRYHPLFYAVVGTVSLPFSGDAALYAMRLATAALAALFAALALLAVRTWARTATGPLGVVLACSPVVLYSGAIVAPNGVEMTAALALWCALTGLAVAGREHLRRLVVLTTVAGTVLCTLRSFGPLWCLLIAVVVLVGVRRPPGRLAEVLRRRDARIGAALVALGAVQSVVWILAMSALKIGEGGSGHTSLGHRLVRVAEVVPAWVLQCIAAFPQRDDATHPAVYGCYLVVFGVLTVAGLRSADRRLRAAYLAVAAFSIVFPFVTTVSSYDAFGTAWQGRYGLPLAVGTVVLCGFALDRAGRGLPGPWAVLVPVLFVIAQVVSVGYTLHVEVGRSPLAGTGAWLQPPLWLACVLALAGAVLMVWGVRPTQLDPTSGEDLVARLSA